MNLILKSLVGSRAHGLHNEDSDYDYRGVHILPTSEILSIGYKAAGTQNLEGSLDETSYEIGHFLKLCTSANPSVLEVLLAEERVIDSPYADEMRELLPYMYDPRDAFNAFVGYSRNQQKKMLEDKTPRRNKAAIAYLRTLHNLIQLLETGSFPLKVENHVFRTYLMMIRGCHLETGEIMIAAGEMIRKASNLVLKTENRKDLSKINDFLIRVRKENW